MMIPLAGCKKGKSKGKGSSGPRKDYVEEDDPYFSSNEVELKIDPPENSDKEIESQELYSPRIVGGKVMSEYYLSYKMPKDIQEKVDSFDWESGDYAEIEKIYAEYYKNGLVIFDLDGNVIKNVETEGSEGFSKIIPKKDGGFYATRYKLLDNDDECRAQVELVTIDENFEVTDSVTLDDSVQDIDKIIELDNGNFIFVGYSEVYIVGKDGKLIASDVPENWIVNYFKQDGKVYACFDEYNEAKNEDKMYAQVIRSRSILRHGVRSRAKTASIARLRKASRRSIFSVKIRSRSSSGTGRMLTSRLIPVKILSLLFPMIRS